VNEGEHAGINIIYPSKSAFKFELKNGFIYLPIKINDRIIECFLDSGSNQTIIDEKLAESLNLKINPIFDLVEVTSTIAESLGQSSVEIEFNNKTKNLDVLIFKNIKENVLLGSDFLQMYGLIIDYENNLILFRNSLGARKRISFKCKSKVRIPPFKCMFVDIYSDSKIENLCEIEPSINFQKISNTLVANSLYDPNDSKSQKIMIANYNDFPVTIFNGQKVGFKSLETVKLMNSKFLIDNKGKIKVHKSVKIQEINPILKSECKRSQLFENLINLNIKNKNLKIENYENIDFNVNSKLSELEKHKLKALLESYSDIFSKHEYDLGFCDIYEHKIETGKNLPVSQPPYRLSKLERDFIKDQVRLFLDIGIIAPSVSSWSSSPILTAKQNNGVRMVIDYRKLNDLTEADVFPLPRIDTCLDCLSGSQYFAKIDLTSGFYQIGIHKDSQDKTTFITPEGCYKFRVLSQGLKNSPACFQRTMNAVLSGLLYEKCICFIDDALVFGKSFDEFLERLNLVLERFRKANLKLKKSKCEFGMTEIEFLGFLTSGEGRKPSPKKVEAIVKMKRPTNIKEVQSFLGAVNYNRASIKNCSSITKPLYDLTNKIKNFNWEEIHTKAFNELKQALIEAPILSHFKDDLDIELITDASDIGCGAVLNQIQGKDRKVVCYISKIFSGHQKNWNITTKEYYACYWSVMEFRNYLIGRKFTLVTDHKPIVHLRNTKKLNAKLYRWTVALSDFDFDIKYKTPIHTRIPDALSRLPLDNTEQEDPLEISKLFKSYKILNIDMKTEQMSDLDIQKIIFDFRKKNLFQDENYILIDDILYKRFFVENEEKFLIYLPNKYRLDIIKAHHLDSLSGHFSFITTYKRIFSKYFWPQMRSEIENFCKECHECQINKPIRLLSSGNCRILPVDNIFEKVQIDLTGPLELTENGNRYIIIATCLLSKYVEMRALPKADAYNVGKFIYEDIICRHGAVRYLCSDRGTVFLSDVIQAIVSLHPPTEQLFSTAYNPKCQSNVERYNSTVKSLLRAHCNLDDKNWDIYIPSIRFAINTRAHSTTGKIPFELIYNRLPYNMTDITMGVKHMKNANSDNYFSENAQKRYEREIEKAKKRIREKQIRAAKNYNDKHRSQIFIIGDLVMLRNKNYDRDRSTSLQKLFLGPYLVIYRCSPSTYIIQDILDPNIHKKVNIQLLESYYSKNFDFLKTHKLSNRYLADIEDLKLEKVENEYDSDTTLLYYDSDETIIYSDSEDQRTYES